MISRAYRLLEALRSSLIYFLLMTAYIFFKCKSSEVSMLKTILERFAAAYGQKIKFDKSALLCSPNISDEVKASIGGDLGVPVVDCHEKYLGLPTLVGKNKREVFNVVKDRIWKRLQGWKGTLFSKGGKELLIKSVVQAIPSYIMSIFKLPFSLCDEISLICCEFLVGRFRFWA